MCPTKNNIQCLASRVCLNINSLPFCAAYICTLHLAELLSMCVLTQSLDCSICPPLCIWCASLAFHVLLFHILIYIYILIYIDGAMHAVPCMPLAVLLMACVSFCHVQFVSFHLISFSVLLFPFMSFICFACFPTMNVRNPAPAWIVETL